MFFYIELSLINKTMKPHLLIMIFFSLIVISCNKDDETDGLSVTYADGEFPEKILVGSWKVKTQTQIQDFGAQNYTIITGVLKIDPEPEISDFPLDLSPLRSLERIEQSLIITDNPLLTSLEGLHNIKWLGELFIQDNPSLINLDGLRGLDNIAYENPNQSNGRESQIWIRNNAFLENINGIREIDSVKYITIANNPSLQNLNGLESIIKNSYLRTDIGCDSLPYVEPYCGNENLDNFCGLQNLLLNGSFDYVRIRGNAYNPSIQDIIDGNCSQ
jgi:hypothetical protein